MHENLKKFVHYKLNIPLDKKIQGQRAEYLMNFISVHLSPPTENSPKKHIVAPGSWNYKTQLHLNIEVTSGFVCISPKYVKRINEFIRRMLIDHLYMASKFKLSDSENIEEKKDIIEKELRAMQIDTNEEADFLNTMIRKVSKLNLDRGELPLVREYRKSKREPIRRTKQRKRRINIMAARYKKRQKIKKRLAF